MVVSQYEKEKKKHLFLLSKQGWYQNLREESRLLLGFGFFDGNSSHEFGVFFAGVHNVFRRNGANTSSSCSCSRFLFLGSLDLLHGALLGLGFFLGRLDLLFLVALGLDLGLGHDNVLHGDGLDFVLLEDELSGALLLGLQQGLFLGLFLVGSQDDLLDFFLLLPLDLERGAI